jgi:hypothetical protein
VNNIKEKKNACSSQLCSVKLTAILTRNEVKKSVSKDTSMHYHSHRENAENIETKYISKYNSAKRSKV